MSMYMKIWVFFGALILSLLSTSSRWEPVAWDQPTPAAVVDVTLDVAPISQILSVTWRIVGLEMLGGLGKHTYIYSDVPPPCNSQIMDFHISEKQNEAPGK